MVPEAYSNISIMYWHGTTHSRYYQDIGNIVNQATDNIMNQAIDNE